MVTALSRMGRVALAAAQRGWHVIPTGQETGKVPLTAHGVRDATATPAIIEGWWHRWPTANIGLACGAASGIWALDIDGTEGLATLAAIEREHGALPPTPAQSTPKGGRHSLFRYDPAHPLGNRVRALPSIDTRAHGGYVVIAPSWSPAVGAPWAWIDGRGPDDVPVAPAPSWLFDVLERPASGGADGAGDGDAIAPWLARAIGTVAEGARNATAASVAGHLMRRYVDPRLAAVLTRAWNAQHCQPPLPAEEITTIIESVAGRELRRRKGGCDAGRRRG